MEEKTKRVFELSDRLGVQIRDFGDPMIMQDERIDRMEVWETPLAVFDDWFAGRPVPEDGGHREVFQGTRDEVLAYLEKREHEEVLSRSVP